MDCLTNQVEIKQWLVVDKSDWVTTSEDTHTKKSQKVPFGFKWRLLAFVCELIGTKLELVIRRFAAVKPAKRYCKSNRYNFSEN